MSPTLLTGPERAPYSGTVKRLVIFLHGVGADGNDLLSLADMMALPDTHYFSPHAPFPYDGAPFGRQWFSLMDRNIHTMLAGIEQAAPILNMAIDTQMARFNLQPKDVALVGFSQGSMMSLYTAPRRAQALGAVVGISGAMLGFEKLGSELQSKPPVCLIHGEMDEVVPFQAMALAETALKHHGVPVESHARPRLGHGIDDQAIAIMETFLKRQFGV